MKKTFYVRSHIRDWYVTLKQKMVRSVRVSMVEKVGDKVKIVATCCSGGGGGCISVTEPHP